MDLSVRESMEKQLVGQPAVKFESKMMVLDDVLVRSTENKHQDQYFTRCVSPSIGLY